MQERKVKKRINKNPVKKKLTAYEAGKLRWEGISKKKRKEHMANLHEKHMKKSTAKQRRVTASLAAVARWRKEGKNSKSRYIES